MQSHPMSSAQIVLSFLNGRSDMRTTVKQTDWLVRVVRDEMRRRDSLSRVASTHGTPHATGAVPTEDASSVTWDMAVMPNGTGVLKINRTTSDDAARYGEQIATEQYMQDVNLRAFALMSEGKTVEALALLNSIRHLMAGVPVGV